MPVSIFDLAQVQPWITAFDCFHGVLSVNWFFKVHLPLFWLFYPENRFCIFNITKKGKTAEIGGGVLCVGSEELFKGFNISQFQIHFTKNYLTQF